MLIDPCEISQAPQLGFVAGLALHEAAAEAAGIGAPRLALKWPNDLLLDGAKVAGLLLEGHRIRADPGVAVIIGFGVNVVVGAGRARLIRRRPFDTVAATTDARNRLRRACGCVRHAIFSAWHERGAAAPRPIRSAPFGACGSSGRQGSARRSRCDCPSGERRGTFEGLDRHGRLQLSTPAGLELIDAGDLYFPNLLADAADVGRRQREVLIRWHFPTDELVFVPLGGLGEIGMNAALYGFGPADQRQWILVDCGMGFGGEEHLPGIDLVYPDLALSRGASGDNLLGIFITHAHEDHIGALVELWPRLRAPVYATRFAPSLLETRRLSEPGAPKVELKEIAPGQRLVVGPFDIEYVPVAHSIPESNALAIRTPLGLVVHTGDWKLDDTPYLGSLTSEAALPGPRR